MYPHRIRLHGPWDVTPIAATRVESDGRIEELAGPIPAAQRLRVPIDGTAEPFGRFRGRVAWRRNFHAPRALDPDERLWLVFDGVDYFADVSLNGTSLGRHEGCFDPFEYEVTSHLRARNELTVVVDCPLEVDERVQCMIRGRRDETGYRCGGIWRGVRLEVRSFAYLRDVRCTAACDGSRGLIDVRGRVQSDPLAPLTLHLSVADRQSELRVDASPGGVAFTMRAAIDAADLWQPPPLGTPATYRATLELRGRARTADSRSFLVGFSAISFDSDLNRARIHSRQVDVRHVAMPPYCSAADAERMLREGASRAGEGLSLISCAVREPEFYDLADRVGSAILQQLPWHGGYTSNDAFRAEACRQASSIVCGMAHHPSIAAWLCHSQPGSSDQILDAELQKTVRAADPTRDCFVRYPVPAPL